MSRLSISIVTSFPSRPALLITSVTSIGRKTCPLFIQKYITVSETVLHILGFAATLIAVLIVVLLLAKLFTKAVEMASLGWLNKVLGIVFALGTTALVIAILIILFDTVNVKFELVKSNILQDSVLYGHLKDFGYLVFPYMKQLLHLGA